MKVFYVSCNNRGLGVDTYEETDFMNDVLTHASREHIEGAEKGMVLLYLSEADSGFIKVFSRKVWPPWLTEVRMVVKKRYDQAEGDALATELAGSKDNVIVFRPYPSGAYTLEEANNLYKTLKDNWGWAYVIPIEREGHQHVELPEEVDLGQ